MESKIENTDIFTWMQLNPNAEQIPKELINKNERNTKNQTPLMVAATLGNFNFVKQLAPIYFGVVDNSNNSAFNYSENKQISNYLANFEDYSYPKQTK